MSNVLEYIIRAKDLTGQAIQGAMNRVKQFKQTVTASMGETKRALDTAPVEEKFIHTSNVLYNVERALDRLGVKGRDFGDVMDTLERRLDKFNKKQISKDDLFAHFKASMAGVGMDEKNIASGLKMLKENIVKVDEAGAKASAKAMTRFNAMRVATALLNGNVGMFAMQMSKVTPGLDKMGEQGMMAFAAIGAAVMSVTKFIGALYNLIKTVFNFGQMTSDLRRANLQLNDMKVGAENFYKELERANKEGRTLADNFKESANAINEMTKAQNEFNRAQELAAAKSEEERKRITAKYDALNSQGDDKTRGDIAANEIKTLKAEQARLREAARKTREDQSGYLKLMKQASRRANESKTGFWGSIASSVNDTVTGQVTGNDRALAASEVFTNASNAHFDAQEKEAELNKQIKENDEKLKLLEMRAKTISIQSKTNQQTAKNKTAEIDAERRAQEAAFTKKVEDEKAQIQLDYARALVDAQESGYTEAAQYQLQLLDDYYKAVSECRDKDALDAVESEFAIQQRRLNFLRELEKEQESEASRVEKAKVRAAQDAAKQTRRLERQNARDIAQDWAQERQNARDIAQDWAQEQADAQRRADAAREAVTQAWGWYTDKDSLRAKIAEEEKNLAANQQYRRDYKALTRGRWSDEFAEAKELQRLGRMDKLEERMAQWRKGPFGLDVETEATMRVALAEDAQKDADRNLADISEATARAAEAAESIVQLLDNGGQE